MGLDAAICTGLARLAAEAEAEAQAAASAAAGVQHARARGQAGAEGERRRCCCGEGRVVDWGDWGEGEHRRNRPPPRARAMQCAPTAPPCTRTWFELGLGCEG